MGDNNYNNVTLRPFNLSEAEDFLSWARDYRVIQAFINVNLGSEDGIKFFKSKLVRHTGFKAICLNKQPIGAIAVTPYPRESNRCRAAISCAVHPNYWSKRIGERAARMAACAIFEEWPHLERLEGLTEVDNFAIQKAAHKVGFKREGVLRKYCIFQGKATDIVMLSLLSTDVIPRRIRAKL